MIKIDLIFHDWSYKRKIPKYLERRPIMKTQFINFILAISIIPLILFTGCNQADAPNESEINLEGTITISGAWALYPMMIRWQEEYQKLYPNVMFDISAGGAGKGMADALAGAVEIGMVSREIYPEEIEKGAFWIAVTKDAVFPTINEKNPVWEDINNKGVTSDDFKKIFVTGEITTWGQVVGRDELTESIHVFTRSDACGAAATWADYLGAVQEDLLGVGVYGDPGLLDAVIKDPLGIGYNNLNYIFDMKTGLPVAGAWVIPIDINNNGVVDSDEIFTTKAKAIEAVATGRYPSPPARELNLVTQGKPTGLVKSFITWILTDGQRYVDETGYIALPSEKLDEELSKLN
jgi:phosphate transport system substrate-binding protein